MRKSPYLRQIALLVVLGAAAAGMADYVFKARAAAALPDAQALLAFFALFHTSVAVLTFLVQSAFGRTLLEHLGLARTVAALPLGLGLTAIAAIVRPSLATAAIARGTESVLRNAAFRSGYELFYTPVDEAVRRSAKPLIDVGSERLGDALGALVVAGVLAVAATSCQPVLLLGSVALSVLCLIVAFRLHGGYVSELTGRLRLGAEGIDRWDLTESTTRTTLQSMAQIDLSAIRRRTGAIKVAAPAPTAPTGPMSMDPVVSWVASRSIGVLLDALLDPDTDGTIRRRIPRVLAVVDSTRAVHGLLEGLGDDDGEIRFQCARALGKVRKSFPHVALPADAILRAARRSLTPTEELGCEASQTDVHPVVGVSEDPFAAVVPQRLEERTLRHLFTLLSLTYDADALGIAYQGLHTGDPHLRGTGLEYLEGRGAVELSEELRRSHPDILRKLQERSPEPS